MTKYLFRCPLGILSALFLVFAVIHPTLCSAQDNPETVEAEPKTDAPGCSDLSVLPRLPATIIVSCQSSDSVGLSLPLWPDAQGHPRERQVYGTYEFREYEILQEDQQEQAFDNLMQLLPIAGFKIKYSESPSRITARKEETWILVQCKGEFYSVAAVEEKEVARTLVRDAEEISREMQVHHHVTLYGIEFSPDNQSVSEENSGILPEVVKYLKTNPRLAVVVESHKWSENGSEKEDEETSELRAKAVVAWLEAHGVAAERLTSKGLGRSQPVAENDTPTEIQRNERIELAERSSL